MQFSAISWREQATFDVMTLKSLCTKPTRLEFNSVISLKQQSAERHVAPLENIILIPKQPVVVHSPYCCVLSAEAITTNFIVLDLTRPGWGLLESTIYRTRGEHANHITQSMRFVCYCGTCFNRN